MSERLSNRKWWERFTWTMAAWVLLFGFTMYETRLSRTMLLVAFIAWLCGMLTFGIVAECHHRHRTRNQRSISV